jgi:hypothetical protein
MWQKAGSMEKPIGKSNYGSIPHLPNSRLGEGDHSISDGQATIATVKKRDKNDIVIVQEKLDGSNVGVANINGELVSLTRNGYEAETSCYEQHREFARFVKENRTRFLSVLNIGERICGEWLYHACGTMYNLPHEPFAVFDIFGTDGKRLNFETFKNRIGNTFVLPFTVSFGDSLSVEEALQRLGENGRHGALEKVEGAVWRVERNGVVDFLCKFVQHDKIDGKYMKEEVKNSFTGDFK